MNETIGNCRLEPDAIIRNDLSLLCVAARSIWSDQKDGLCIASKACSRGWRALGWRVWRLGYRFTSRMETPVVPLSCFPPLPSYSHKRFMERRGCQPNVILKSVNCREIRALWIRPFVTTPINQTLEGILGIGEAGAPGRGKKPPSNPTDGFDEIWQQCVELIGEMARFRGRTWNNKVLHKSFVSEMLRLPLTPDSANSHTLR